MTPEFASRSFMSIFGMLVWRFDRGHCGGKFAVDSPLEGDGFEPSVPRKILGLPRRSSAIHLPQYKPARSRQGPAPAEAVRKTTAMSSEQGFIAGLAGN